MSWFHVDATDLPLCHITDEEILETLGKILHLMKWMFQMDGPVVILEQSFKLNALLDL